jgi:AAA family ATP:ADP antiporter
MRSKLAQIFVSIVPANKYERLKFFLLTATFFMVIGAYTIVRELKSSIFISIVGKEYVPWAKTMSMFILLPLVLFYSFLVDNLRRYQLLYFYSIAYGTLGLICAYLLGDPSIGLLNTETNPYRFFGWFFYFFIEGYVPFVLSVFWAFANSINNPETAKNNYALMVSGSKIGGMVSAGFAWWLLNAQATGQRMFSDVTNHQILLTFFSILVLLIPIMIYVLMRKVPGHYLHGYEAVYQFEKQRKEPEDHKVGILDGFLLLIRYPYVLGIFGMLFFYEVVTTILSYQRLVVAQAASCNISDVSCFLFKQVFFMHLIGFLISLIGTRALLRWLGEEVCLLLVPLLTGILLFYFIMTYQPFSLMIVLIVLQSINYAFAQPVRESLYIPTIKEVKFKSKSWIDAFGAKLARTAGSSFNLLAEWAGPAFFLSMHALVFAGITVLWLGTAALLGRRYTKAVNNNEVIGQAESA